MRRADRALLQIIDTACTQASQLSGDWLTCRLGCFGCCIGPFPIQAMDAARLRLGLTQIDSATAARIRQKADEAVTALRTAGYPGDPASGTLDPHRVDELFHRDPLPWIPCPALDLETGACELYEWRPIACRTYGPAVRMDGRDLPHCQLNYRGATREQIEACRVEIAPGAAAEEALGEFYRDCSPSTGEQDQGETVVAFALAKHE